MTARRMAQACRQHRRLIQDTMTVIACFGMISLGATLLSGSTRAAGLEMWSGLTTGTLIVIPLLLTRRRRR